MSLKSMVENSPSLIVLGCLFTGFMGGVGATEYLDSREKALREELLAQFSAENKTLKASNEELDATVKNLVVKYISQQAIIGGTPLGGNSSKIRTAVENTDSREILKAVKELKDMDLKDGNNLNNLAKQLGIKW